MNLTVFILLLFALQVVCLIVARRSSKALKTQDDYFLAGKNIRFFPLMMTFLATQVGGGLILGSAEEAYRYGWSVLLYPLGATLGLLLLGVGIGRKLASFKVSTVAQIFEVVYRSPNLKRLASVLSILSLFMIFVAQIIASNKFMISLGVENKVWFIGFWSIVILYTALGGLKAVVATDIIQAAFFTAIFFLTFGYVAYSADFSAAPVSNAFTLTPSKLTGWLLMPLLFMVIEQDMGQRCFAGNSPKTVSRATFWAGIVTFSVSSIPVLLGILAKNNGIEIPENGSVLMSVIQQMTTPTIMALVSCAVLCAIISTADSLINAISSNLAQDFNLSFLKQDKLLLSQCLSAAISLAGIFFSFYFSNVVDLLIQSYELSVSCLFVPIFAAFFKRDGNPRSATLAILFGAAGFIFFRLIPVSFPKEILSILLSFIGFSIGEIWLRRGIQQIKKTNVIK